jgi:glucose uptake protein GlcU
MCDVDPNGPANIGNFGCIFDRVVGFALGFAGIVLFLLLIIGGFKYITSGGDPKAVEGAKKTLTYAIGGLIVILLSYLILVIIKDITGVDVTKFNVVLP